MDKRFIVHIGLYRMILCLALHQRTAIPSTTCSQTPSTSGSRTFKNTTMSIRLRFLVPLLPHPRVYSSHHASHVSTSSCTRALERAIDSESLEMRVLPLTLIFAHMHEHDTIRSSTSTRTRSVNVLNLFLAHNCTCTS